MPQLATARPEVPDATRSPWTPREREGAPAHDARLVHQHIRKHHPAFRLLARREWVVFLALDTFIRKHDFGFPTQAALALHSGYAVRSVQYALDRLRHLGIVVTRQAEGALRYCSPLRYMLGPVAEEALASVIDRYPREATEPRAKALPRVLEPPIFSHARGGGGYAKVATPTPAKRADLTRESKEPSSCANPAPQTSAPLLSPSAPEQQQASLVEPSEKPSEEPLLVSAEDRAIAREALALRAKRKAPKAEPPCAWDTALVEMVSTRVAQTRGSREDKLTAQEHAITGAFLVSHERAPTARFIWGEQEHFLAHVERGEKKARNDARIARERDAKATEDRTSRRPASAPSRGHHGAGAPHALPAITLALLAQWNAEEPPSPPPPPVDMATARAEIEAELAELQRQRKHDTSPKV